MGNFLLRSCQCGMDHFLLGNVEVEGSNGLASEL